MSIGNACIVLDCSQVRQIDKAAIYLLLSCLENALKRDGDVKLASIHSGARAILEFTGVARLFECFETNAEAVCSFRRLSVNAASGAYVPFSSHRDPENAA
jgi:anti-anti-sigma regulatory factor